MMSHAEYCRFENTVQDMNDCIATLEMNDWDINTMIDNAPSEYEATSIRLFVQLCQGVVDNI